MIESFQVLLGRAEDGAALRYMDSQMGCHA